MNSPTELRTLTNISDLELVGTLKDLVAGSRVLEAELLAYLGEMDARRLYLEEACSSFGYCTEVLHFSEASAYGRITAARAARRFPVLLERIRSGALHLCGVRLLAPHLTPENHVDLIAAAEHKGERAIEALLADRHPKPSVSPTVRKLPCPLARSPALASAELIAPEGIDVRASLHSTAQEQSERSSPTGAWFPRRGSAEVSLARQPLGQDRFRIQFTADRELHATLREAQALLRHQIPDGDLAEIFRRGLELLVSDVKRKRFATGVERPQVRPNESAAGSPSRAIPAAIRREVYERDEGRCTFVSGKGRRCSAREFLEFHHLDPWARCRQHRADRIVLLCKPHNQHAAVRDYGRHHMERYRRANSITCELVPGRVGSQRRATARLN